ncbi:MAG: hypothetical protein ACOX9E_15910 [Lentisphaeria bacterium]|jgi:hypothetical protein
MRALIVILLIVLGIIAYVLVGGDSGKKGRRRPAPQQTSTVTAPAQPAPQEAQPQVQQTQAQQSTGSTVSSEISGVVNYGIGATQVQAKKSATSKIKNINEKQNRDLEKAMR